MTFIRQHGEAVLRRWRIVVAVLLLTVVSTVVWTLTKGQPSWTATTALTTQSQTRAPEQDAVLSLGYVDYFNQPTYQEVLRAEAAIPADVVLKAETGAASPILYVEAKAATPDRARSAAQAAADAFRLDIRNGLVAERQKEIDDLQKAVDDAVAEVQKPATTDAERNVILDQIRSLQGRIADIASDATNHLKTLQTEPGLTSSVASPALAIAGGAFGGLLLGILVALGLALLDGRIRTARDALNAGARVLGEFTAADDDAARVRIVEHMVNSLRGAGARLPATIAVVGLGRGFGSRFAAELITIGAPRRSAAVLVDADLRSGSQVGPGLVDVLDGAVTLDEALVDLPDLQLLPAGDMQGGDPYEFADPDRMAELVAELSGRVGLTVFETAPLQIAPETQVLCSAVSCVILVARRGVSDREQLRTAWAMLERADVALAGVVIDVAAKTLELGGGANAEPDLVDEQAPVAAAAPVPPPVPVDQGPGVPVAAPVGPAVAPVASAERPAPVFAPSAARPDDRRPDERRPDERRSDERRPDDRAAAARPDDRRADDRVDPPAPAEDDRVAAALPAAAAERAANGDDGPDGPRRPSPWPRQASVLAGAAVNGRRADAE